MGIHGVGECWCDDLQETLLLICSPSNRFDSSRYVWSSKAFIDEPFAASLHCCFCLFFIFSQEWPEENPFRPEDFFRADSLDDSSFYTVPRLVYHIDEPAVGESSLFRGCTCWELRKQKCLIFVASVVSPF